MITLGVYAAWAKTEQRKYLWQNIEFHGRPALFAVRSDLLGHVGLWHRAPMARITGIGGVFFKSKSDHKQLAAWYARHLGLVLEEWGGAILKWPDDKAEDRGLTVWHVAEKNSDWFSPSASSFMINYRVDDLDELLTQVRRDGVAIVKGPESHENGRFAWILDPDGNKVELWQPMVWDEKNKQP